MNLLSRSLENIIKQYPLYDNFINNYFIENKLQFFKDNSLNYNLIPNDCRTNNYLENYNGFIKLKLGKNRVINWINFINFIKEESSRAIEKLFGNELSTFNINDKEKLENNDKQEEFINHLDFENARV